MEFDLRNMDFGADVTDVFEKDGCRMMRLATEAGEGIMTVYHVFEGVYIMYNNFHMESCRSDFAAGGDVLCIDHCREGRIETGVSDDACCCLSAGELRIDNGMHNHGISRFPLNHYYGLTIAFELDKAQASLDGYITEFKVRLSDISRKYCTQKIPYVLSSSPEITHIFSELYNVPSKIRRDYCRIKVLELLLYLDALEIDRYKTDKPYFYKGQVEKIHAVRELMVSDLTRTYTIEELSRKFDIAPTALKKCFSSVYGSPIFSYMKNYRLDRAAALLKNEPSMKVADIAMAVGYESASKFSMAFRKEMGKNPLDYRKYAIQTEVNPNEK
ncbi:AraC family transcriptional regulator [Ruminococcus sp.]|uniref:helix-turn-helix domain-containing protein n=1 Tax=Ruminococcus sp. TaxID=41978 RepID=UPI002C72A7AB|nr:AraC family transcriptional regulator [Ruminococcus sp.]HOA00419.1 AraC family transcriptional regulator [Ruminococcus sp.]HOH86254.1 AraC family transcriptional regulator [Ruminococcus sp.]